jgi:hypothetical protein
LLARLRLGWLSGIEMILGDSRVMLQDLVSSRPFHRPLAYLDAHWGADLPLEKEVALLCDAWQEVTIVVDDFRVDDDDGYGYDEYQGKALALDDVTLPDGLLVAFPAVPSHAETGGRRGTLYVANGPDGKNALSRLIERGMLRQALAPGS